MIKFINGDLIGFTKNFFHYTSRKRHEGYRGRSVFYNFREGNIFSANGAGRGFEGAVGSDVFLVESFLVFVVLFRPVLGRGVLVLDFASSSGVCVCLSVPGASILSQWLYIEELSKGPTEPIRVAMGRWPGLYRGGWYCL